MAEYMYINARERRIENTQLRASRPLLISRASPPPSLPLRNYITGYTTQKGDK
jgi:hypothetical protein